MKIKLMLLTLLGSLITGCASEGLKAPCNQYASFCGSKTKINHW